MAVFGQNSTLYVYEVCMGICIIDKFLRVFRVWRLFISRLSKSLITKLYTSTLAYLHTWWAKK